MKNRTKLHANKAHKDSLTFNERIAVRMTRFFGSMSCFYLFVIWALLPFIPFFSKFQVTILYVSAGFIQLVALPLISVGQNLQSRHSEFLAEATYQNDLEMHKDIDLIKSVVNQVKAKLK